MPLVCFALLAYLGGLLAGFSGLVLVGMAAVGGAALVGYPRGRAAGVAFPALAIAGIVAASVVRQQSERCLDRAVSTPWIEVIVEDSVAPGTYVRGHVHGCDVYVGLSVAQGTAPAGSIVHVHGDLTRSARGLQLAHAIVVTTRGPSLLRRWRTTAGHAIERTFRDDAPLVKALLVADWSELSPAVKDRFAAAGLSHMLSISGLHIAIIAAALELTLELFGVSRRRAALATIGVSVFYVALIGAPLPAIRCVLMSTTALASRLAQRPVARWSVVAIGAMHPVFDPVVVLDAGYQLSVIGIAAIIAAAQAGKRLRFEELRRPLGTLAMALLGTSVATIASAPIIAWIFGRISVVGLITNLAANPIVALAQPMIFLGMLLAPLAPVGRFVADAAHPLLAGLDLVAATGAAIPGATVTVIPTAVTACIACVVSGGIIVACASRNWMTPALIAAAGAVALLWLPATSMRARMVELHVIDVGQGDAVALRTAGSHWILFDAGGAWRSGDAGRSTVVPYIGRRGGPVDAFVLSHPHTDHVGGAATVLSALKPRVYVDPGFPGGADAYRASLEAARARGVRWTRAHPGDSLSIDGVTVTFLAPDSVWTASLDDPNLASVVALVRYGDVRMLLVGDAERAEEEWLLAHGAEYLRADILKVGHHGSRTSSSEAFLAAVRPRLALVSVGSGNTYGLPNVEVMHRLAAGGAQVLRTDRLGTIVARTNGRDVFVDAAGDQWQLPRDLPHD